MLAILKAETAQVSLLAVQAMKQYAFDVFGITPYALDSLMQQESVVPLLSVSSYHSDGVIELATAHGACN